MLTRAGVARVLSVVAVIMAVALLLMLLAAGLAVTVIATANWLGLDRALGIDTQNSQNYAFVSGSGPMFIAALGFSSVAVSLLRHLNCEQPGCWRLGHRHPDHGRPVCKWHYHEDLRPPTPKRP